MIIKCKECGHKVRSVKVDYFLEAPEWEFWGETGNRWKVCESPYFIHFKVKLKNGGFDHRAAIIKEEIKK